MTRSAIIRTALLAGVSLAFAAPAQAQRGEREGRVSVEPYIEAAQVLTADLDDDGDVLTYTSIAAGIDVSAQGTRVEGEASYRYEHRFSYDNDLGDDDIHSGLARVAVKLAPGLSVEGGALATRSRNDIRGASPEVLAGNVVNKSQLYSAYAGPTYATLVGPLSLNAGYRIGYTKVEEPALGTGVPGGQPVLDLYDDSVSHLATASIGTRAGTLLPIGFTVSGAWEREEAGQLDQRFEGIYGRADAVLPVSPTVAAVGGVGYEKIEISQRDALVDAGGVAVVDGNGRFVTDSNSPRRLAYDTDGLFWDAGVVWRPNRRTMVEARVGRRYETMTYIGSLSYAAASGVGVQVGVYDSVTSFGQGLRDALSELPTAFVTRSDPFGDQFDGCVFGRAGAAGGCLSGIFQSVATSSFRARGIDAVVSVSRGRTGFGIGGGYANRRFLVPDVGPAAFLDGIVDESYYAQAYVTRELASNASLTGSLNAELLDPGLPGAPDIFSAGGVVTLGKSWGRLDANASLGLSYFDQEGFASDFEAQALLGVRYGF